MQMFTSADLVKIASSKVFDENDENAASSSVNFATQSSATNDQASSKPPSRFAAANAGKKPWQIKQSNSNNINKGNDDGVDVIIETNPRSLRSDESNDSDDNKEIHLNTASSLNPKINGNITKENTDEDNTTTTTAATAITSSMNNNDKNAGDDGEEDSRSLRGSSLDADSINLDGSIDLTMMDNLNGEKGQTNIERRSRSRRTGPRLSKSDPVKNDILIQAEISKLLHACIYFVPLISLSLLTVKHQ